MFAVRIKHTPLCLIVIFLQVVCTGNSCTIEASSSVPIPSPKSDTQRYLRLRYKFINTIDMVGNCQVG
jgi:hypothetical protein